MQQLPPQQVPDVHSQNYFARQHTPRRTLPDPVELAGRLEEAKTSAKVLHDIVANTSPQDVLGNELIKEFADRCLSASRSIQGYMNATDPTPDHDTMESLIDTNEQLQASMSLHQRAMLNARKQSGTRDPTNEPSPLTETEPAGSISRRYSPVSEDENPPRTSGLNGKGKARGLEASGAGTSRSHTPRTEEDPFKDPEPERASGKGKGRYDDADGQRHADEPFHPGFGTTPSYMNRQESALGKEAMHGAIAGGSSASKPAARRDSDGDSIDSDLRGSKPVYRY